jgi:hypothetical protein
VTIRSTESPTGRREWNAIDRRCSESNVSTIRSRIVRVPATAHNQVRSAPSRAEANEITTRTTPPHTISADVPLGAIDCRNGDSSSPPRALSTMIISGIGWSAASSELSTVRATISARIARRRNE